MTYIETSFCWDNFITDIIHLVFLNWMWHLVFYSNMKNLCKKKKKNIFELMKMQQQKGQKYRAQMPVEILISAFNITAVSFVKWDWKNYALWYLLSFGCTSLSLHLGCVVKKESKFLLISCRIESEHGETRKNKQLKHSSINRSVYCSKWVQGLTL